MVELLVTMVGFGDQNSCTEAPCLFGRVGEGVRLSVVAMILMRVLPRNDAQGFV